LEKRKKYGLPRRFEEDHAFKPGLTLGINAPVIRKEK